MGKKVIEVQNKKHIEKIKKKKGSENIIYRHFIIWKYGNIFLAK